MAARDSTWLTTRRKTRSSLLSITSVRSQSMKQVPAPRRTSSFAALLTPCFFLYPGRRGPPAAKRRADECESQPLKTPLQNSCNVPDPREVVQNSFTLPPHPVRRPLLILWYIYLSFRVFTYSMPVFGRWCSLSTSLFSSFWAFVVYDPCQLWMADLLILTRVVLCRNSFCPLPLLAPRKKSSSHAVLDGQPTEFAAPALTSSTTRT